MSSPEQEGSVVALHEYPSGILTSRKILLAMTQLGGLQAVLAITGLVRNKVAAVYLNTSGMGEWSQIQAVATVMFTAVQFGMSVGLSRNTAAANTDAERQNQLSVANTLTASVVALAVITALALSFTSASHRIFTNLGISRSFEFATLLFIVLLCPIEAVRNNFLSFLQGILDIRGIAAKRSIAVVIATIAAIPLVAYLGTVGACLQFALASLLLAILLGQRCRQLGYAPLQFRYEKSVGAKLASLGLASLLMSFISGGVDVLIRAQLIRQAGLSEAGIYQAALLLSSQVTQIALGSIGVFSLASVSKTTQPDIISDQLHAMYRVVLPITAVGLGMLGLFGRPVVQLLFSAHFSSSADLLPVLLLGNAMQAACWVAGAPLLGCGRVGTWLTVQVISASLRYGTVTILLPVIGTQAIPLALLLGQTFDLTSSLTICSRKMGIATSGIDLRNVGLSILLPGIAAWIGLGANIVTLAMGLVVLGAGTFMLAPDPFTRYASRGVQFVCRRLAPSKSDLL